MFSFDGNYRRTPVQSLGGASRNSDRMTLIKKAAEERLKRAEIRRQNDGALRIQAYVRSFIRRQKVKAEQRRLFDQMIAKTGGVLNEETLHLALQRILFFYYNKSTADGERLVFYFLLLLMFFVKLFFSPTDCPRPVYYQKPGFPVDQSGGRTVVEIQTEAFSVPLHASDMPSDTQSGANISNNNFITFWIISSNSFLNNHCIYILLGIA